MRPPNKCDHYDGSQATVVLMIDDLANGFLNHRGNGPDPASDWGFLGNGPGSIYRYFDRHFLELFPEAKFTVFLPMGEHAVGFPETGYAKVSRSPWEPGPFRELIGHILESGHEIAYHGRHHGLRSASLDPYSWSGEYRDHAPGAYAKIIQEDLEKFRTQFGRVIAGGKFPAYQYGETEQKSLAGLGLKWWVFDYDPRRRRHGRREGLLDIPANLPGNLFPSEKGKVKGHVRAWLWERRLAQRVSEGGIISIQEHFMSTRPDGKRQTPNVFDDILSLQRIYRQFRGADLWHTTCSELAAFLDSRDSCELRPGEPAGFLIQGGSAGFGLTLKCDAPRIRFQGGEAWIEGRRKGDGWIYNRVQPGQYEYGG
jgi:hypothetical protein